MAGWINDYRMDYSPVVNALNSKYKNKAENRAFTLKMLESAGNLIGRGIDTYMKNDAVKKAEQAALASAQKKDEAVFAAVKSGQITLGEALRLLSKNFDFGRLNNDQQ